MRSAVVAVIAVVVTLVWLAPALAAERNIGLSEKQAPDAGILFPRSVCRDSRTETLGEQTI